MIRAVMVSLAVIGFLPSFAAAQTAPAAPAPAPTSAADDTPTIRVGTTIFTDYTYVVSPESTNADGVSFHANAFNLTRGYVNITGTLNRYVAFRITPDIARETSAQASLSGSIEFRVKYAYAQFNLDHWMGPGAWVRLGVQQTPWLDFMESVYRYRFQGTMLPEREGYFASADAGASFHYSTKSGVAEVHTGIYNGENYNKAEANDQKAVMIRGTLRPFAKQSGASKGLRLTAFYDHDAYVNDAERTRFIGAATFEHRVANAAVEYLATGDRQRASAGLVEGRGYSLWITPKLTHGWEGLLRFDHMKPDDLQATIRQRTIAGIAYWIPMKSPATTALLLDYDGLTISNLAAKPPADRKIILHALIVF
jgi:hypothetical protein